jgi:hypothetical protein
MTPAADPLWNVTVTVTVRAATMFDAEQRIAGKFAAENFNVLDVRPTTGDPVNQQPLE